MTRYLSSQSIVPTQSNYALYGLMIATQGALDTSSSQRYVVSVRFARPNGIANSSGSPMRFLRRVYFDTLCMAVSTIQRGNKRD